jgi:hypothetical protein
MMFHERLVERRCKGCGTAWLLTHEQASISAHRPHLAPRGPAFEMGPASNFQAPDQFGAGMDPGGDTDALLAMRDLLRACPKCQLQNFEDRKVTKASPASPDASGAALP